MISKLEPNERILVGTNTEGRHGAGLAKFARSRFGLEYGHSEGPCGQCYCIVTKDLKLGKRSISLERIESQLVVFNEFCKNNPDLIFYLTLIGTNLAGYSKEEIIDIFNKFVWPSNVRLEELK